MALVWSGLLLGPVQCGNGGRSERKGVRTIASGRAFRGISTCILSADRLKQGKGAEFPVHSASMGLRSRTVTAPQLLERSLVI